ncbi:MAG: shikimate dehydrogenase [Chloroflexota bacterium]
MRSLSLTKRGVCGVIGDPIEHSLSPLMHNAAFRAAGLDYIYLAFRVKKEALGKAISGMRALDFTGLNVTIPHKVNVIKYLDSLDPIAGMIGAVNTIVNRDGVLAGYNTDATGFLEGLTRRGIEPKGKRITLLGAGGAARAIAFILAREGARLAILNRTPAKARSLVRRIKEQLSRDVATDSLSDENLKAALAQTDILVNTTSVGMTPDASRTPVPQGLIPGGLVVYDIVYNPPRTRLLREAEARGATTIGGLDMLVFQGAKAFELFTGVEAPIAVMQEALVGALKQK